MGAWIVRAWTIHTATNERASCTGALKEGVVTATNGIEDANVEFWEGGRDSVYGIGDIKSGLGGACQGNKSWMQKPAEYIFVFRVRECNITGLSVLE